jgi:2-dehydro-3-deoxygluconokinase
MVRLTADRKLPLEYATDLHVDVGGAELNVLIALVQLGCRSRWVSRLPDNQLGRLIAGHASRHGVQTDIDWHADGRAGLYFVEEGVYPRPTQVLYDRAGSAASQLRPGSFDWPAILRSATVLHCTGITCALGPDAEQAVQEALQCAAELGVLTSFDVNYRGQLWSPEAAAAALARVLPRVDLLFASPFDFQLLTGSEVSSGSAAELRRRFGLSQVIVRTQAEVNAGLLEVTVEAFGDESAPASGTAQANVLDAFGAGDAAVAAFLARYLAMAPLPEAVAAAAEASAYMYTIPGDTWIHPPAGFTPEHGKLGRVRR